MQEVTKFKSIDGRLFDTPLECTSHESMLEQIKNAMSLLKPKPENDNCKFANGDGYIQQNVSDVLKAMVEVVTVADPGINKSQMQSFLSDPFACRNGIIGRYLSDCGNNAAWEAWSRFMCIDDLGREWGQPYYASHPEDAKQYEIQMTRAQDSGEAADVGENTLLF